MTGGGYDDGYAACDCFWGREPGSMVARLLDRLPALNGLRVLDVGCGEGKNAVAFAQKGAVVTAVDCSALALRNARRAWPDEPVEWIEGDVRAIDWHNSAFDIVVAYGVLHCFRTPGEIREAVMRLKRATRVGGYHVICSFNARHQVLTAHPGFNPCLMPHMEYEGLYSDWLIEEITDEDLHEVHPHNDIPHVHSLTRLIARRDQ